MHSAHSPTRLARLGRIAAALTIAAAGVVTVTQVAAAGPVTDFYTPPAQFATEPGSIIRTEPMSVFALGPGGNGQWPVAAQRVLFTSQLQDGSPTAVSGSYIPGTHEWNGAGARPTIVIAPGTAGQGDQCAASVAMSTAFIVDPQQLSMSPNQEAVAVAAWNELGANVFVTDYVGQGTPGMHTYVNRLESAHAVLDAARAATRLGDGPNSPLALWGYSQGGGATAAAAELQPEYAPELNLKGVWAGAPVADLNAVLAQVDGTLISGVIGFALNGFLARYPELQGALDSATTPAGRATLETLSHECIGDLIVRQPFIRTSSLTVDGRPMLDHLREIPEAMRIVNAQHIGTETPRVPVLITSGINDDTVPYTQARQLATDWCRGGARVTFRTNTLPPILPGAVIPNHFGPEIIDGFGNNAIPYLLDRLADKPVPACTFD